MTDVTLDGHRWWLFSRGGWSHAPVLFEDGWSHEAFEKLGYADVFDYFDVRVYGLKELDEPEAALLNKPPFLVDVGIAGIGWGPVIAVSDLPSLLMLMSLLAPIIQLDLTFERSFERPHVPHCERPAPRQGEGHCKREEGHSGGHANRHHRW